MKESVCLNKKEYQSHVVFPNWAGTFLLFYPSIRLVVLSNFVRLMLHTWQINSVMKHNIYASGTQMEKKL